MKKTFHKLEAGDIVRVNLDPTIGDEKRKERFCLVLEGSQNHLNLIIVLPITEDNGSRQSQIFVPVDNLHKANLFKPSVIDCYQIRTISTKRLRNTVEGGFKFGSVSPRVLFEVRKTLSRILDIDEEHLL